MGSLVAVEALAGSVLSCGCILPPGKYPLVEAMGGAWWVAVVGTQPRGARYRWARWTQTVTEGRAS